MTDRHTPSFSVGRGRLGMSTSAATSGCFPAVPGEFMLFGVRVVVSDPMRKCVSLNNLSEYQHPPETTNDNDVAGVIRPDAVGNEDEAACLGYASADEAVHRAGAGNSFRERKRGVPWTEEEHKLFLVGLQKVGKGDWRGVSRNYVKTRTPTQIASHAQKYFLRLSNINRHRRRSSLFDITADTVADSTLEKEVTNQDDPARLQSLPPHQSPSSETCNSNGFHSISIDHTTLPLSPHYPVVHNLIPVQGRGANNPSVNTFSAIPFIPVSHAVDLPDHQSSKAKTISMDSPPLSLNQFTGSDKTDPAPRRLAFEVLSSLGNGDGLLTVV